MNRSKFIQEVLPVVMEKPVTALRGHGIKPVLLKAIANENVMTALLKVGYVLKNATKLSKCLVASNGFMVKVYRNFNEANKLARLDVEEFSERAGVEFTQDDAICILVDGDNLVSTKFEKAVTSEGKIPGALYIVICVDSSAVRPKEEKLAITKARKNKIKEDRRTPAKIKAELKRKANKKLNVVNNKVSNLESRKAELQAELDYINTYGNQLGAKQGSIRSIIGKRDANQLKRGASAEGIANIKKAAKEAFSILTDDQKYLVRLAKAEYNKNPKSKNVSKILASVPGGDEILAGFSVSSMTTVKPKSDIKELKAEVLNLKKRGQELAVDLALAPEDKKISVRSMISKNKAALKAATIKYNAIKGLNLSSITARNNQLNAISTEIDELVKKGASIRQALQIKLATLENVTPVQKQIIAQQIAQQVALGTPIQVAVKEAVDNTVETSISEPTDIESLLASL